MYLFIVYKLKFVDAGIAGATLGNLVAVIAGDGKRVVTRLGTNYQDDDAQDISHYHPDDGQDISHYHPVIHKLVRPWSYRTIRLDTPLLGRREVEL